MSNNQIQYHSGAMFMGITETVPGDLWFVELLHKPSGKCFKSWNITDKPMASDIDLLWRSFYRFIGAGTYDTKPAS